MIGGYKDYHLDYQDATIRFLERKLDDLQYKYDNLLKAFQGHVTQIDKIFQDDDCILPNFCRVGDDKFEACVRLAGKYKELCDLLKKNRIEEQFYNNHDKFLELINYE